MLVGVWFSIMVTTGPGLIVNHLRVNVAQLRWTATHPGTKLKGLPSGIAIDEIANEYPD